MKICFIWIIDASHKQVWWDRIAYSISTLLKVMPADIKADYAVLDASGVRIVTKGREWISAMLGERSIIEVNPINLETAKYAYNKFGAVDFSPCIFFRLFIPEMKQFRDYDAVISVDADAEWIDGVRELIHHVVKSPTAFSMCADPFWNTWGKRLPFGKIPDNDKIKNTIGREIDPMAPYFSAGLIGIRPATVSKHETENINALIKLGCDCGGFGWIEQDIINLAVEKISQLPPEYNVFSCQCKQSIESAKIIQWAGANKDIFDTRVQAFINDLN